MPMVITYSKLATLSMNSVAKWVLKKSVESSLMSFGQLFRRHTILDSISIIISLSNMV